MIIFHGSKYIEDNPEYGKGKPYNDYGRGFYCTEDIELAKEWSVDENGNGYANKYNLDTKGLNILYLNSKDYNILHWITLLLKNRSFSATSDIAREAKKYLINNFSIDTTGYDVIIGYRADDSYFAYANNFLNNTISINKLSKAMKLGNLGEQVVLVSVKAFKNIHFIEATTADNNVYFPLKTKRDYEARKEYLNSDRNIMAINELYIMDIIRQEIKEDDPRLQ